MPIWFCVVCEKRFRDRRVKKSNCVFCGSRDVVKLGAIHKRGFFIHNKKCKIIPHGDYIEVVK